MTLEEQLRQQLGQHAKTILDKTDKMLAQKGKREDIEKMIEEEIIACTKERMEMLFVVVT